MTTDTDSNARREQINELANALLRNHTGARDAEVVHDVESSLQMNGFLDPSDPTELIQTPSITRAIIHILLDKHLCGYSVEELTSWHQNPLDFLQTMPYIGFVMLLTHVIVRAHQAVLENPRLLRSARSSKVEQSAAFILERLPRVWQAIWDIKTPFLDFPGLYGTTLYKQFALLGLRQVQLELLSASKRVAKSDRLAHVQLAIWIYGDEAEIRSMARDLACRIVMSEFRARGEEGYIAFRAEVATGVRGGIATDSIAAAIHRDLEDETFIDQNLNQTLYALLVYSTPGPHSIVQESPSHARVLLAHALAACRRELCRTGGEEREMPRDNLHTATTYMFADTQVETVRVTCTILGELLSRCRDVLRSHSRNSSGSTNTRRRLKLFRGSSRRYQQAAVQAIRTHGQKIHSQWNTILQSLDSLGEYLNRVEDGFDPKSPDTDGSPFTALKRCHWSECLCSVYKPSHRLRICEGCWRVAYCNKICQSKDWLEHAPTVGGHPVPGLAEPIRRHSTHITSFRYPLVVSIEQSGPWHNLLNHVLLSAQFTSILCRAAQLSCTHIPYHALSYRSFGDDLDAIIPGTPVATKIDSR
ncbi:uncharacterized protein PHACADRAFT_153362 [Phanerochaete carnosa HHB-10118-sp]|uniref:MYND-type domain-containing protein n=1 Tax=Phanerochaete carnosa (strain HHB-10118-sp) TaxID=650164 RepID=K5VU05_PHACS|nr:uncharacterized protein PHACADRAFT_153362 [Phanerochaete carnosa HHB-10118-sp]EKM50054.1 hypothetical protein PHACADRAFT_153362 [Phanerochaete carnosa HHB-10118-sp]